MSESENAWGRVLIEPLVIAPVVTPSRFTAALRIKPRVPYLKFFPFSISNLGTWALDCTVLLHVPAEYEALVIKL